MNVHVARFESKAIKLGSYKHLIEKLSHKIDTKVNLKRPQEMEHIRYFITTTTSMDKKRQSEKRKREKERERAKKSV